MLKVQHEQLEPGRFYYIHLKQKDMDALFLEDVKASAKCVGFEGDDIVLRIQDSMNTDAKGLFRITKEMRVKEVVDYYEITPTEDPEYFL